jgi:hypothetical protein
MDNKKIVFALSVVLGIGGVIYLYKLDNDNNNNLYKIDNDANKYIDNYNIYLRKIYIYFTI